MPKSWTISSIPPHDFFIGLDVDSYFDHEHLAAEIPDKGFIRTIALDDRDVIVTVFFNGDVEEPKFPVEASEDVTQEEKETINATLSRILGTDLDLKPLYEQAGRDPVLAPLLQEYYGLKRMARGNFFEDSLNRIIKTQIQHAPTARKMVYGVREAFSATIDGPEGPVASWPQPERLSGADPHSMKKYGLSLRKGEYVIGLAEELVSGHLNMKELEQASPESFYNQTIAIRGIGPTTAQDLMLFRNRTDAVFPSHFTKGRQTGLRMWIIHSYGGNPDQCTEAEFHDMIKSWKGCEAAALEFLYVNWVIGAKKG
ncbi:MAG: hypothetical protein WEB89_04835 [Balneolales bacterium]